MGWTILSKVLLVECLKKVYKFKAWDSHDKKTE